MTAVDKALGASLLLFAAALLAYYTAWVFAMVRAPSSERVRWDVAAACRRQRRWCSVCAHALRGRAAIVRAEKAVPDDAAARVHVQTGALTHSRLDCGASRYAGLAAFAFAGCLQRRDEQRRADRSRGSFEKPHTLGFTWECATPLGPINPAPPPPSPQPFLPASHPAQRFFPARSLAVEIPTLLLCAAVALGGGIVAMIMAQSRKKR